MAYLPLREVRLPGDTEAAYDAWLGSIQKELSSPECDRFELCRKILTELYYPALGGESRERLREEALTPAARITLAQMNPRNVTLEPEYYHEIDPERYARVKPLIWLWEMFDKSPLGENIHLGIRFRRVLAPHIFRKCGRNFKAFHHVKFSFGYNLEVGDDVVVHRHVLLDDRGGIRIGNRSSVSDFANVYSHSHDIVDPREVVTPQTVIGDGVRITYHATILAGIHLADDSMVGAGALVTKDTEPHAVYVGVPARLVKRKPDAARKAPPADPLARD